MIQLVYTYNNNMCILSSWKISIRVEYMHVRFGTAFHRARQLVRITVGYFLVVKAAPGFARGRARFFSFLCLPKNVRFTRETTTPPPPPQRLPWKSSCSGAVTRRSGTYDDGLMTRKLKTRANYVRV